MPDDDHPPAARPAAGPGRRTPVWPEIVAELRWTLTRRLGWLVGIGFNLVVAAVYVGYGQFHGHSSDDRVAGLATGIALWVLADVVNTNQFGADAERVTGELERGDPMWLVALTRNASLAFILIPLTVAISVVARLVVDRWRSIPSAVMLDLFVVFMWLGVGTVASVLLPYRPISLRDRWRARRSWPRWACCLALPYGLLASIGLLVWPAFHFAHLVFGRRTLHERDYAELYLCWGLLCWIAGVVVADRLVRWRGPRFIRSLGQST